MVKPTLIAGLLVAAFAMPADVAPADVAPATVAPATGQHAEMLMPSGTEIPETGCLGEPETWQPGTLQLDDQAETRQPTGHGQQLNRSDELHGCALV